VKLEWFLDLIHKEKTMLKITPPNQTIEINGLVTCVYGSPGVGKSSLAFTGNTPLLLDCDKGAHRSHFRKDIVQVSSWTDIAEITDDDVAPYHTIVIDTVGRCLDYLAADIIKANPKHGFQGNLSLQGYGVLKGRFKQWIDGLTLLGKDIILIAHEKEEKKGDEIITRPDIVGGSYGEVFKIADLIGYMTRESKKTTLDFIPTDSHIGKDAGQLGKVTVPDFNQEPTFFNDLLLRAKESINRMSVEGQRIAETVANYKGQIEQIDSAELLNDFCALIKDEEQAILIQLRVLVGNHAKKLDLTYDKEAREYV